MSERVVWTLGSWILAAAACKGILGKYRNKQRIIDYWKENGNFQMNNETRWRRMVAAVEDGCRWFAVSLLICQFVLFHALELGTNIVELSLILGVLISCFVGVLRRKAVFDRGEFMDVGSSEAGLEGRDKTMTRRSEQLIASNEHGSADLQWAEQNGMADPEALNLGNGASK